MPRLGALTIALAVVGGFTGLCRHVAALPGGAVVITEALDTLAYGRAKVARVTGVLDSGFKRTFVGDGFWWGALGSWVLTDLGCRIAYEPLRTAAV